MAENTLASAYVQLLPSFRGFEQALVKEMNSAAGAMRSAGSKAGSEWAAGFATTAKTAAAAAATSARTAGAAGARSAGGSAASHLTGALPSNAAAAAAATAAAQAARDQFQTTLDTESIGVTAGAGLTAGLVKGVSGEQISALGMSMTKGITLPLAAVGVLSTKAAINFESAFAGVRKTVDGTEQDFAMLRQGLIDMANVMPLTREELSRITELGGQFGLEPDSLLGFTKVVADLGNATNISGEEAATFIARFGGITGVPVDQFDRIGSVVAELGNNSRATESEIAELALRLSGAGAEVGLAADEILGISAALSSVGIRAEAGGTALSRAFIIINDAVATGSKELGTFAQIAGVSADEFASMWKSDPAAGVTAFVEGLGTVRAEGEATKPILEELGLADIRVSDSLRRLSAEQGALAGKISMSSDEWKTNTALVDEANKRYGTTESRLKILGNNLSEVGVEIGDALLPVLVSLAEIAMPFIQALGTAAEVFGMLPTPVAAVAVGLLATAAAVGPLTTAFGFLKTSMAQAAAVIPGFNSGLASIRARAATGAGGIGGLGRAAGALKFAGAIAGAALLADGFYNATRSAADLEDKINALNSLDAGDSATVGLDKLASAGAEAASLLDQVWRKFEQGQFGEIDINAEGSESVIFSDLQRGLRELVTNKDFDAARLQLDNLREALTFEGNQDDEQGWISSLIRETEGAIRRAESANKNRAAAANEAADAEQKSTLQTSGFSDALASVNMSAEIAAAGVESSAAAVEAFTASMARGTSLADVYGAALTSGQSIRELRVGLRLEVGEDERKDRARKVAEETDRIANEQQKAAKKTDGFKDALDRLNPSLSRAGISLGAAGAAAEAFSKSIADSSGIDDQVDSALTLGAAFREFRVGARRLPPVLDRVAASTGKYRKRQAEQVQETLQAGKATTDYLATLIRSGESHDLVRSEAARMRAEFERVLRQAGRTEAEIAQYIKTLGLTPKQIDTAINVSGDAKARFKIEAYAQLLEGKIPASISSQVIAEIESGDLEGAGGILAAFASTNPIDIEVDVADKGVKEITAARDALDELHRQTMDLPQAFDYAKLAVGGYTEAQERGLQALLAAGDGARAFIESLISRGEYAEAAEQFESVRGALKGVLEDFGVTGGAAETMLDQLVGLSAEDFIISVKVSLDAKAMAQLNAIMAILEAADIGVPQELAFAMNTAITSDDPTQAAALLTLYSALRAQGKTDEEILLILSLQADTTAAERGVDEFGLKVGGFLFGVPIDANTAPGEERVGRWRRAESGAWILVPADAADGAARSTMNILRRDIERMNIKAPLDLDTSAAQASWRNFQLFLGGQQGFTIFGGMDGDPRTAYATGGPVYGRAAVDAVPAVLTAGEFVMKTASVDKYGLGFMHAVNAGTLELPGFNSGGPVKPKDSYAAAMSVGSVPQVAPTDPAARSGAPDINLTIERLESPSPTAVPEDLVRGLRSELHLTRLP